ncbi:MAG: heme-binding protein, partial [Planctomycetota bacterium]
DKSSRSHPIRVVTVVGATRQEMILLLVILNGNNTDIPKTVATRHIRHQKEDHLLPRSTYYGHNTNRMAPGGFVLICKPDGSARRVHCAGFRNPYDFAFNRDGELFTFDADMEYDVGGPWYRPTRVNHTVSGADFGWRWGAGKWPAYYPDTVGAVADIGRGSPTGVAFGYGAKFPAKYQNALFISDWTYGRMFAVHMTPDGASYKGVFETFVQGKGMPISDVVVHPKDGALYYITGGRRQQTRLFRVTYVGSESTAPVKYSKPNDVPAKLRELRKSLEAYHGNTDPNAVVVAWPHLKHADRFIRFAARTAIEHQDPKGWSSKALAEKHPVAAIEAAVALARASGDKAHRDALLSGLNRIHFAGLKLEQQLDLLRAYGLVFIRMGGSNDATSKHLVSALSPVYPSGINSLDRELCQMLHYLNAPGAVTKSVKLLLGAETQADEMFYSYHLRTVSDGWSVADHQAFFGWLNRTEAAQGDYVGGGHFRNFLKLVRRDSTKRLSGERKEALAGVLSKKAKAPKRATLARKFVKAWTMKDLKPHLARVESGRAFIRGRKISEALCSSCHLFNGKGGAVGPDLSSVGNKMNYEALLQEILDPSRVISEQHASTTLVLKGNKVLDGRIVGSDDDTIRIVTDAQNPDNVTEVKKGDVLAQEKSKNSLMPNDILNVLTEEEILDLLMYLASGGKAGHIAFDK